MGCEPTIPAFERAKADHAIDVGHCNRPLPIIYLYLNIYPTIFLIDFFVYVDGGTAVGLQKLKKKTIILHIVTNKQYR
jgi:hypothetical protein